MKRFSATIVLILIFLIVGNNFVLAQPPTSGGTPPTTSVPPVSGGNPPAAGGGNPINITLQNPFRGGNTLFALLRTIINDIVLPIGGVLVVLSFIYSGFIYVTARGNEDKITKAHKALLWTAVGTAVLLGAWVFANVICHTLELISGRTFCPS